MEIDEAAVREALRKVIDPEVGINIVDLGLVYAVRLAPGTIEADLTMTSPACPLGDMVLEDARAALDALAPAGTAVRVNLVWEPPWSPEMMSPGAKGRLGWE